MVLMAHCIFIERACIRESSESIGGKSESGRESERCKEGGREVKERSMVCEVGKNV